MKNFIYRSKWAYLLETHLFLALYIAVAYLVEHIENENVTYILMVWVQLLLLISFTKTSYFLLEDFVRKIIDDKG